MKETERVDCFLETWLRSLADAILFIDSIIRQVRREKRFITIVAHIVKSTVHGQVQGTTVQARFQVATRESQGDSK